MAHSSSEVTVCRQTDAALQKLQAPNAPWRLEEAKLLWAQGQTSLALRLLHAMIDRMPAAAGADSAQDASHAGLLTLAGKWMAHTRYN